MTDRVKEKTLIKFNDSGDSVAQWLAATTEEVTVLRLTQRSRQQL